MSKNYNNIKINKKVNSFMNSPIDISKNIRELEDCFQKDICGYCLVNKSKIIQKLRLIDTNLPKELEKAKNINNEKELILTRANNEAEAIRKQAQIEAKRIIDQAQIEADSLTAESTIIERATEEANNIVSETNARIADATNQINSYSMDILISLKELIDSFSSSINQSIEMQEQNNNTEISISDDDTKLATLHLREEDEEIQAAPQESDEYNDDEYNDDEYDDGYEDEDDEEEYDETERNRQ